MTDTKQSLLLLIVGLIIIFVVLTKPGDQPLLAFCGGAIVSFAVGRLVWNWGWRRGWRRGQRERNIERGVK